MRIGVIGALIGFTCSVWAQGGEVVGRLEDPSGAVLVDGFVALRNADTDRVARSGLDGVFSFRQLPAGTYSLVATMSAGFRPRVVRSIVVQSDHRVELGSVRLEVISFDELDWRLTMRLLLETRNTGIQGGTVVDEKDRSVQGATVLLNSHADYVGQLTTGLDGKFRFVGLKPGRYQLSIAARGYYPWTFVIEVIEGVEIEYTSLNLEKCAERTCDPARRPAHIRLE